MSGTTRKGRKALIVGGGIAGPVTAMALGRAGIEAVVYEAHGGGADDAGAFLTLASNGLDALRAIDAHRHVLVEGFPTPRMEIQSGTGKLLGEVPNGGTLPDGTVITPKYVGPRRIVEVAVTTLATDRALLLLGVPGTAKTWVSEHLAAAVSVRPAGSCRRGPWPPTCWAAPCPTAR